MASVSKSTRVMPMPLDPEWYSGDGELDAHLSTYGPVRPPPADPSAPLAIDFGASEVRAGFVPANSAGPLFAWPQTYFPNVVSKYRERKRAINVVLGGQDAYLDAQSRANIKTPYDGDVVTSFDATENVLDCTFHRLGIESGDGLSSPILMTETLLNPGFSRSMMTELLFETYGVPSVCYGLDALFSAYQNGVQDGLVVSSGQGATHVVPMLNGRGILPHSRRINWGGAAATNLMLKLVQLKYLDFPVRVTTPQASKMVQEYTYVALDYDEELEACSTPAGLKERDLILQFPYSMNQDSSMNTIHPDGTMTRLEPSEEERILAEQKAQEAAERKRAGAQRLIEQAARMRAEKSQQKENLLISWIALREGKGKEKKADWLARLQEEGFDNEAALEAAIKKADAGLKRARARQQGGGAEVEESTEEQAPSFPLISVPDHSLDEQGIKEKRKQRLMKAGYDARQRLKAEKAAEEAQRAAMQAADDQQRFEHPKEWSDYMRKQYDGAIERIIERRKRRAMLSDRKSLAAQLRMKSIANLASESTGSSGKRKRGGDDDTFGADDDDWGVYKEIQGAEDSDEEEEELRVFENLENKLLEYDPSFTEADTWAARRAGRTRLTGTWLRGSTLPEWEDLARRQLHPRAEAEAAARSAGSGAAGAAADTPTIDPQLAHQIHLNIERIRVPEVFFQPNMAGVDQAGLDELCAHILRQFETEDRSRLATNVFLTGQHTLYPQMDLRLRRSLQMTQPVDLSVQVTRAQNARFDPWRGMARFIRQSPQDFALGSVTRAMYLENGPDYFRDHPLAAGLAFM